MLRELFWDCAFDDLRWESHRDYVIGRVLACGGWQAIQWLRARVMSEELKGWLLRHDGRGLSARQLRFWEVILDLPHDLVTRWLAAPERQVWEKRIGR